MARYPSGFGKGSEKRSPQKDSDRPDQGSDTYKGLCANCAKRKTCLIPEREEGVWHCEQYVEEQ